MQQGDGPQEMDMVDYTFVNEAGEEVVTKISLRFAVRLLRLRGGSIR